MYDLLFFLPSTDLDYGLVMFGWVYFFCYLPFVLFGIKPPYGKFTERPDITLPGTCLPATTAWIIQESPSFLFPAAAMIYHIALGDGSMEKLVMLVTFTAHYTNRTFIFPWNMRKKVPILICVFAFFFCGYNGFMQSHAILLLDIQRTQYWTLIPGLLTFITGMAINIYSDRLLQNLRRPGQCSYVIPYGGLFHWVSCPNYAGEILEWWGFALLTGTQAACWFACWSSLFLGSRAVQTHRFYKQKFKEDYPTNRTAIIPFIL